MLIQVDVDSTLYDADKLFGELAEEAGIKWPYKSNSWSTPGGIKKFDGSVCSREDLVKVFRKSHSKEVIMQQKPYKNAARVLQGIAEDFPTVEIAYVSDRNGQAGAALRAWLEQEGFLVDEHQDVVVSDDKRHWMKEKRPEIVIDDRVRTILFSRYEIGSTVLTIQHNHNINLLGEAEDIHVLKDWDAIDTTLREVIEKKLKKTLSLTEELV